MHSLIFNSVKNAVKYWYIPLLTGIFFVIVGIVVFASPVTSLLTLSVLFALSFLFGGISEVLFAIGNRRELHNWGWTLTFGIITLIAGLLLLLNPALSVGVLAFYIGFTILFRSIAFISFAIDLKRFGNKEWGTLMVLGILGAIFSFILIWNPLFAGMSVVVLVALSFLMGGFISIYFAFQLRKLHRLFQNISPQLRARYTQLETEFNEEYRQSIQK